jgi:hypothetical protein
MKQAECEREEGTEEPAVGTASGWVLRFAVVLDAD